jgi:hypothetical protein
VKRYDAIHQAKMPFSVTSRVSTEFRHTEFRTFSVLPSLLYSVRNYLKVPRNFAEFRTAYLDKISRHSVIFHEHSLKGQAHLQVHVFSQDMCMCSSGME